MARSHLSQKLLFWLLVARKTHSIPFYYCRNFSSCIPNLCCYHKYPLLFYIYFLKIQFFPALKRVENIFMGGEGVIFILFLFRFHSIPIWKRERDFGSKKTSKLKNFFSFQENERNTRVVPKMYWMHKANEIWNWIFTYHDIRYTHTYTSMDWRRTQAGKKKIWFAGTNVFLRTPNEKQKFQEQKKHDSKERNEQKKILCDNKKYNFKRYMYFLIEIDF